MTPNCTFKHVDYPVARHVLQYHCRIRLFIVLPSFLKEERNFTILQAGIVTGMWGMGQFFGGPFWGCLVIESDTDMLAFRRLS